jgi:putative inorganic carbon (HCO3(-)) transporter
MFKTKSIKPDKLPGIELVITLLTGCIVGFILFFSGTLELKWTLFIIAVIVCLAAIPIIPDKEKFFLYLFFLVLPIDLDFHPVYKIPTVYRPLNGIAITLYELPLFCLLIFWIFRLATEPDERINFYPWISIPFLIIFTLSTVGIHRTLTPTVIKFSSLWVMIEMWLVFMYLANNLTDRKKVYVVVSIILFTLVLQAFVGLAQKFAGGQIGLDLFGEGEKSFRHMRAGSGLISRVGGTIGSPNKLALYIGMILPINFALLFAPIKRQYKILFLIPIFVLGSALEVITFSRGGWVGLGIGIAVTLYWCLARITARKIVPLILMIVLLVTIAITTLALVKPIRVRLFEEDYGAAKTRIPMAAVASNMIYQHPWLGVGFVNYTSVSSRYDRTRESISYVFPWPVHNEFLLIAAELGLPALGLFLFILIVVFRMLFRIGHSRGDPFISHTAIGLLGGLAAWCIHLQVEFAYVLITMPIWAFIGVIQAMEQIANENVH